MKHPAQVHERDRIQRAATQRMSNRGYTYRARQRPAEMLQSVACLVGAGKSHIAQALAHLAVRAGAEAQFTKTSRVLASLAGGRADRTWDKRLAELTRPTVLVLDLSGVLSRPSVTSPAWARTTVFLRRRVVIQGPTPTSATSA